jgi:hypothetical protein
MPEAIDTPNHRIYLYCIGFDPDIFNIRVNNFINDTLVLSYHSPDDGETLLVEMNKDEMCWAIENMPRRGVNVISIGPFSIDIFDIHIEARFENLPYAKIFQLNRRLKDLRKWPRKALEVWAGTHLRISGEQYSTAVEMDQKYKFVQYAQEMFTHQCGKFNKKAKKVIKDNPQPEEHPKMKVPNLNIKSPDLAFAFLEI